MIDVHSHTLSASGAATLARSAMQFERLIAQITPLPTSVKAKTVRPFYRGRKRGLRYGRCLCVALLDLEQRTLELTAALLRWRKSRQSLVVDGKGHTILLGKGWVEGSSEQPSTQVQQRGAPTPRPCSLPPFGLQYQRVLSPAAAPLGSSPPAQGVARPSASHRRPEPALVVGFVLWCLVLAHRLPAIKCGAYWG